MLEMLGEIVSRSVWVSPQHTFHHLCLPFQLHLMQLSPRYEQPLHTPVKSMEAVEAFLTRAK